MARMAVAAFRCARVAAGTYCLGRSRALHGPRTMIQETGPRAALPGVAAPPLICHEGHRVLVAEQMRAIGCAPRAQGIKAIVMQIVVKPAGRLSLQKHHHLAGHWIVVAGTARVTCGRPSFSHLFRAIEKGQFRRSVWADWSSARGRMSSIRIRPEWEKSGVSGLRRVSPGGRMAGRKPVLAIGWHFSCAPAGNPVQ